MKKLVLASAIASLTMFTYADHHEFKNFSIIDENQDGMLGTEEAMTAFPDVTFEDSDGDSIVSLSEAENAFPGLDIKAMMNEQEQDRNNKTDATDRSVNAQQGSSANNDQQPEQLSARDRLTQDTEERASRIAQEQGKLSGESPVRSREYQLITAHLRDQENRVSDSEEIVESSEEEISIRDASIPQADNGNN